MSNAKRFPHGDCEPFNRWPSPTRPASNDGATKIPCDSIALSCTPNSGAKPTDYGVSVQDARSRDAGSLLDRVASVDYLERIGSVVERMVNAADQSAVQALLSEGASVVGAENAVFVSFVRDNVDVSSCRFMLACDPTWCRQYLAAGLIAHDPWLAYAAHHSEPIIASTLTIDEPERRQAIELATRNGFASAVLVPVHSGTGHSRNSLLCLGSPSPGYFEAGGFGRFKLGAGALACELHEWW